MGRALSVPLQSTFRGLSQTPGPAQAKSIIPAPEKYNGKKGPAAKSFILDCKTYFLSNASSFPSDHSRISFILMSLKDGQPKKWGQIYPWDQANSGIPTWGACTPALEEPDFVATAGTHQSFLGVLSSLLGRS
ncbi:hypothetical protein RHS01_08996 [Rhizoctonia solani]|uniref:Uncharacterized protein n=1 Tax=Rhizoctonia solani TaxID=456999 RepID=A0A8H7LYF5_9AGAM|nr:hypothetical protein RHS01_08996 [Rhizoctonia solani]